MSDASQLGKLNLLGELSKKYQLAFEQVQSSRSYYNKPGIELNFVLNSY